MIKRMVKKRLCNDNLQIHDLYNYNSLIDNKLTRRDDFRQIVSTTKELLKITKPELNNFSAERSIHKYLEASKEVSGIYKSGLEEVHKKINLECKDRAKDFNFLFKGYSHQVEQERKILQNHIKDFERNISKLQEALALETKAKNELISEVSCLHNILKENESMNKQKLHL